MRYVAKNLQDIIQYMAACDTLGFGYSVQKGLVKKKQWFTGEKFEQVYILNIFEEVDEEDDTSENLSEGGLGEDSETK